MASRYNAGSLLEAYDPEHVVMAYVGKTRVGYREGAIGRPAAASDHAASILPTVHSHIASVVFRHQQIVAQVSIFHCELVQAAPVAAGFDESQTNPRFPLQRRHTVHRIAGKVARQRHAAEYGADGFQALLGGS